MPPYTDRQLLIKAIYTICQVSIEYDGELNLYDEAMDLWANALLPAPSMGFRNIYNMRKYIEDNHRHLLDSPSLD